MNKFMKYMPSLRISYYMDLIKRNRVEGPKTELSSSQKEEIFDFIKGLNNGAKVRVRYYDTDAYITSEGAVNAVHYVNKYIFVGDTSINFDDIMTIERLA